MPRLARLASVVLACLAATFMAAFVANTLGVWAKPGSLPGATDFVSFWAAAHMALAGHAAQAYDNAAVEAFERAHTAMSAPGYLAFYYPPTFLLLCVPLGVLPYVPALFGFVAGQGVVLFAALRRVLPAGWAVLPLVSAPGFLMNAASGQNGGLSAACLAGGMIWLERRPLLAGACLAGLACKPQLALAVPVAVLAARRWRVAAGGCMAAAGLALASLVFPGPGAWRGFFANAGAARADLESLAMKWRWMQTVYAGLRQAGAGLGVAYAGHAVVALGALVALALLCRRRPGAGPEMAALTCCVLLTTPFLYDYDLVVALPALAWLAGRLAADGAAVAAGAAGRGGEMAGGSRLDHEVAGGSRPGGDGAGGFWRAAAWGVVGAVYLAPFAARAVGIGFGVPVGPPLILALLALVIRRGARA